MQVTKFDKKICRLIHERVNELLTEAIQKEFGLEIRNAGGTYLDSSFTMKLDFHPPISSMKPTKVSAEEVKFGLARIGTRVRVGTWVGTVIKARRTKYLVEFDDRKGKYYVVEFERCALLSE